MLERLLEGVIIGVLVVQLRARGVIRASEIRWLII